MRAASPRACARASKSSPEPCVCSGCGMGLRFCLTGRSHVSCSLGGRCGACINAAVRATSTRLEQRRFACESLGRTPQLGARAASVGGVDVSRCTQCEPGRAPRVSNCGARARMPRFGPPQRAQRQESVVQRHRCVAQALVPLHGKFWARARNAAARRRAARRATCDAPASAAASALPTERGGRWSGSSSPSSSASKRCRIASAGSALMGRRGAEPPREPYVTGTEPAGALGAAPELPCGGQEPPCTSGRGASRAASSTAAPGALPVTSDAMAFVAQGCAGVAPADSCQGCFAAAAPRQAQMPRRRLVAGTRQVKLRAIACECSRFGRGKALCGRTGTKTQKTFFFACWCIGTRRRNWRVLRRR